MEELQKKDLPGILDLTKRSFELYKNKFWSLVGIMLVPLLSGFLFLGLWAILSSFVYVPSVGEIIEGMSFEVFSIILVLVLYLILILISLWSQVALLYVFSKEEKIGFFQAFKASLPKMISYCWLSVISAFLIIGSFLFFLIPGIVLLIWFSLSAYVFIAEGKKGTEALSASKELVSGKWGTVFLRYILVFVLSLILYSALEDSSFGKSLFSFFVPPFIHAFFFLFYKDLKEQKKEVSFVEKREWKFIVIALAGYAIFFLVFFISLMQLL